MVPSVISWYADFTVDYFDLIVFCILGNWFVNSKQKFHNLSVWIKFNQINSFKIYWRKYVKLIKLFYSDK